MIRLIKTLIILSAGGWFSPGIAQQPVALAVEQIRISDFGLENRITSAIDLVGPDTGPAGRNRRALARRMQCWIDDIEGCLFAGRNDPRVRAIRQFLAVGPAHRDGLVDVEFPDRSRIDIRVARTRGSTVDAWEESAYRPVVLPDTARAPELRTVPFRPVHFEGNEDR